MGPAAGGTFAFMEFRKKEKDAFVYGIHPVLEALQSGRTVDKVWLQEGVLQDKTDVVNLPSGNYQMIIRGKDGSYGVTRFIKL